jgi:hypothetical protein
MSALVHPCAVSVNADAQRAADWTDVRSCACDAAISVATEIAAGRATRKNENGAQSYAESKDFLHHVVS